ncbi:MAG: hypothetical protein ACD_46C00086G0003 [uncultured bacterium]|nr:MAG: hypothetical protein ACD_46C00086G0003 [uncultured bacterium]
MTILVKFSIILVIVLWASAFVGIRVGLRDYSPEGLALLRFIIASILMGIVYWRLPNRRPFHLGDTVSLFLIGALGVGIYHIALNYGEITVSSGMASFIISQSPIITALLALIFLGEQLNFLRVIGFFVSLIGIILITVGEEDGFKWDPGVGYIVISAIAGSIFSVLQKPFLRKYHPIEVTTFLLWGATLFLSFFIVDLKNDLSHASLLTTSAVIYLGIFPAAVGYIAWSYILSQVPASRAVSYLYCLPFVATLLGWICLGEVPAIIALLGGIFAITGVWIVNHSYRMPKITQDFSSS